MAKEIQPRLPNPQRSLTSVYSRPNATGPQAPAPLARPSTTNSEMQIGSALMNLVQPVTQYGVKREQQEIEMLQQQEALKIDKMNIEEQRNYLAKLAREAEQYGTIARGSNFFRIKFAQEHAAAQIMQNSYQDALSKQINKFSDPMAPQDDFAQFALDTFQTMQFPGFYAQVKATEMYEKMSSNFQTEVRRRKGERMVAQNKTDLAEATYSAIQNHYENPTDNSFESVIERIEETSNSYYQVERTGGREIITRGLSKFFQTNIAQAVATADKEKLARLEKLFVRMETDENGEPYKEGPLAFGDSQVDVFDSIDTLFSKAHETIKKSTNTDMKEQEERVGDAISSYLYNITDPDVLENSAALSQDLRAYLEDPERMKASNYSQEALQNVMVGEFATRLDRYRTPFVSDKEEEDRAWGFVLDDTLSSEQKKALVNNSNIDERTKVGMFSVIEGQLSKDVKADATLHTGAKVELGSANASFEMVAAVIQDEMGNSDPMAASEVLQDLNTWSMDKAKEHLKAAVGNDSERVSSVREHINSINETIKSIVVTEGMDTVFDLNIAREAGLPESVIADLAEVNRSKAGRRLLQERKDTPIKDEVDSAGLWGGWALHRPIFDYAPELNEIVDADMSDKNRRETLRLQGLMEEDAAKHINEMVSLSQSGEHVMYSPPGFSRPYHNTPKKITPEGIQITFRERGEEKPYEEIDEVATQNFVQAIRINGLTNAQMRSKNIYGLDPEAFPELTDPHRTLMVPRENFKDAFIQIGAVNTTDMDQETLFKEVEAKYGSNGIIEGYKAYVDMVGEKDAIGFDYFLQTTLEGIGRYTLEYPDAKTFREFNKDLGTK